MANVLSGTSALADQVQAAYDRVLRFGLRNDLVFDQFARVKPGNLTSPGSSVNFTFWTDMAAITSGIAELTDVDSVVLADTTLAVTPVEYGNVVTTSAKVRADTLAIGFDSDIANVVSWNMVDSLDGLAAAALDGSSTEDHVGQASEGAITSSNIITTAEVRQKAAELRTAKAIPYAGSMYAAVIHPDVAYDLMSETGDGAWVNPAQYIDPSNFYNGEIGSLAGFKFMSTPRATLNTDGGSGTVDTYTNYFIGNEALVKAESISPHIVIGPVVDRLKRFQPVGWYAYLAYDTFREACLSRLLSASSIGTN